MTTYGDIYLFSSVWNTFSKHLVPLIEYKNIMKTEKL